MTPRAALVSLGLLLVPSAAPAQTSWDPHAVAYTEPSSWQQAAVATLNRHLPTDSGYWVLGPLDRAADTPDTLRLVTTTLRVLAPDPESSRRILRYLWVPTGGVALEELQPADTLPHEPPPGYPGRFVEGTLAGQRIYAQVMTVTEHRWVLWAQRAQLLQEREGVRGPLARYSEAVHTYLAALDSGRTPPPPGAERFGLDPIFDLLAAPPAPVIRDRTGYLSLLEDHRVFTLEGAVRGVYGFVPGPALSDSLIGRADDVLFKNKSGERALQHRYREYREAGGDWIGYPVLTGASLTRLRSGRYAYVVDRYGALRVGRLAPEKAAAAQPGTALLAHGEPVLAAGELEISVAPGGGLRVSEANIRSDDYLFSNRALSIYEDVERRSDRYVRSLGHVVDALVSARVPHQDILLRKF